MKSYEDLKIEIEQKIKTTIDQINEKSLDEKSADFYGIASNIVTKLENAGNLPKKQKNELLDEYKKLTDYIFVFTPFRSFS